MSYRNANRAACAALLATAVALSLGACADNAAMESDNGHGRVAEGPAERAVRDAREYLWTRQKDDGSWPDQPESFPGGATALVVWAMVESGVPADDPRIQKAAAWLKPLETDQTYTLSVRANALGAIYAQTDSAEAVRRVRADVSRLVGGSGTGGYTYSVGAPAGDLGDKSNSHYAVMGAEAGEDIGLDIPRGYWQMVMRYWLAAQNPDGGWPYSLRGTPSSATMTAAGVATLGLVRDRLETEAADAAIAKGLAWLDQRYAASLRDPSVLYYYFLAMQRMGRFVDRDRLGGRPWRTEMRQALLARQKADGHWEGSWGPDVSTAYALLVLARQQR